MKQEYEVRLLSNESLTDSVHQLTFYGPEIAKKAVPGQFINLSCSFYLKRPFGISRTNKEKGTFSIGVKMVGKGTEEIINSKPDDVFTALGPLGNGFSWDGIQKIIIAGGGTGIFPLHFVLSDAKRRGIPAICVKGFQSKTDIFLMEEFKMLEPEKYIITTDMGDFGMKGNVLDALLTLNEADIENAAVFCVGPEMMMKHVAAWAESQNLFCQISMEKRMACGIGVCLVCVCKQKHEEKDFHHVRCCCDGPVFNAADIIFE